ncbi:hypothetical protein GCM10010836_43950 [Aminobacter aminovorans]
MAKAGRRTDEYALLVGPPVGDFSGHAPQQLFSSRWLDIPEIPDKTTHTLSSVPLVRQAHVSSAG